MPYCLAVAVLVSTSGDGVWIVQHDEDPHNTVVGVFASVEEADEYAERVGPLYTNGVIYSLYETGYKRHSDDFLRRAFP